MKKIIIFIVSLLFFNSHLVFADIHVNGYENSNGQYVQPYFKTSPNKTFNDNFSTKGNINPYTGQPGYKH